MSDLQRLIQREFTSKEAIRIVTVIGDKRLIQMNQSLTAPMWVTDVEFGGGRPVGNVPIKSINGSMFYAQRGQTVQVRKSVLGRWQIVGPGDRVAAVQVTKEYDLTTGTQVGGDINTGFSFIRRAYEFYGGPQHMLGNPSVTFTVTGGDDFVTRSAGSWIDDGFTVGDTFVVSRTQDNDGVAYVVTAVTALQLDTSGTFVGEGPLTRVGIGVVGSSLWNNGGGFPGFPEVSLIDADGNLA